MAGPISKPTPRPPKPPRGLTSRPRGIPAALRLQVFERDEYLCQWCKVPGGRLDPHHIIPRGRGGKDVLANLVSLHRQCHRTVHEHPWESRRTGFLA